MAQDDDQALAIRLSREPPFLLGAVEVHPATRQVLRDGRSETLEPRIMQVLVAFAQAKGSILGHDELIDRCWDGRVVGDNAIHRAISKLRDLGLNFGHGTFEIETITKVGYRMSVREADGSLKPQVAEPLLDRSEGQQEWRASRRSMLGAGAAASVAGASGLGYLLLRPDPLDVRVADLVERSDEAIRNALPETDAQGVGFLEEAVALEPNSKLAWGRLAVARGIAAEHASPAEMAAAVAGTQDAARRALALDSRQADGLAALALLPPYYGDWLAAERRMDAVLALYPEHLAIRDARCFMHVAVGRGREGCLDRLVIAAREPLHAGFQFKLIYAYWILGDIGAADRAADRALQLWPKHPGVWLARLWTLAFTGRASRALAQVEDEAGRPDFPPWMIESLHTSMAALVSRRPADVDAAVASVLSTVSSGPSNAVGAVLILCGLGEVDRAFDVASAYLLERGPLMARVRWRAGDVSVNDQRRRKTNMLFVPVAAAMRADPRFIALTADIGLKDYWDRVGVVPDFLKSAQVKS
jgi:DNA-binding winged helix-turn-helix (wHTH) protein/tetratricopeptide (TPR) repeat protein